MSDLHPDLRDTPADGLAVPVSALTIGAHPDDAEFGAGGTLAGWAEAGAEVTILVVTDGSKGTWDPGIDPADLVASRKREQHEAAEVLGAARVVFLDHVDGELEYSMGLRAELCEWIRRIAPDVVLTHDPWQRYQLHPDHRVTGTAALDAVVAARDHLFFSEQLESAGLQPHRPGTILLWSADEPNHWENIAHTLDTKIAALLRHASQSTTTMGSAGTDAERRSAFAARVARRAAERGAPAGMPAAESFRRLAP